MVKSKSLKLVITPKAKLFVLVWVSTFLVTLLIMNTPTLTAQNYNSKTQWGSLGSGNGQFNGPSGIAVDTRTGVIYVADTGNDRIEKFSSSHTLLSVFGSNGTDPGNFFMPQAIAVDNLGYVYVSDTRNSRVQKFNELGVLQFVTGQNGSENGQFYWPWGIIVDENNGYFYVADWMNHRIQKFNATTGQYVSQWGSYGTSDGQFNYPRGMAIDAQGNIYVSDQTCRIQKFTNNGDFLLSWGSVGSSAGQFSTPIDCEVDRFGTVYVVDTYNNSRIQKFTTEGVYLGQWGSRGSSYGQFQHPRAVAVDNEGNVYVADGGNNRIQVFSFPYTETYHFISKWGTSGNATGQFNAPLGIAVEKSTGDIYVCDNGNRRIQKFSSNHAFITAWGTNGSGIGEFASLAACALDSSGNVYVSDSMNNRVQKFTSDGTFITQWGSSGSAAGQFNASTGIAIDSSGYVFVCDMQNKRVQKFTSDGSYVTQWGTNGTGDGQFIHPSGIAVDSSGDIYVGDSFCVQKFSNDGAFKLSWGSNGSCNGQFNICIDVAVDSSNFVYVTDSNNRVQKFTSNGTYVTQWGSTGSGNGQFRYPWRLAFDSTDNIYVTDSFNSRVQVFSNKQTQAYTFVHTIGTNGTEVGQYVGPKGVGIDKNTGDVYVVDMAGNKILKYSSSYEFITSWGSSGTNDSQFNFPAACKVDSSGNVYVADSFNSRVQKFSSNGTFITKWGSAGTADGQFSNVGGLAIDNTGNYIYVCDLSGDRVQKFTLDGTFVSVIGSSGIGDGQFNQTDGVAVDSLGNVYVVDSQRALVQKFSSTGVFLSSWSGNGTGNAECYGPIDCAVDSSDNVYVADCFNYRIQKFTSDGEYITQFGVAGLADEQFMPFKIAIDAADNLYVADSINNAVKEFSLVTNIPVASISPSSSTVEVGSQATFTTTVTNGTGSLAYRWYVNDILQRESSPQFSYSPSVGSYNIYSRVTDDVGYTTQSNAVSLTVNPASTPKPRVETPVTQSPTTPPTATPTTPPPTIPPTTPPTPTVTPSAIPVQELNLTSFASNFVSFSTLNSLKSENVLIPAAAATVAGGAAVVAMSMPFITPPQVGTTLLQKIIELLPKTIQDFFKRWSTKKLEKTHGKVIGLETKTVLVAWRELRALVLSIIISFPILAYVDAVKEQGYSVLLNVEAFSIFLCAALISSIVVRTTNFGIETFCSYVCGYKKDHSIWLNSTATFIVTGLLFRLPFAKPSITIWQEMSKGLKGQRSLLKYLLFTVVIIPFALLSFSGDGFFAEIGKSGVLLVLVTVCSSLLPVDPLPGSNIYVYNKRVAVVFLVSVATLMVGFELDLLLPLTCAVAGVVAAIFAPIAFIHLRRERKFEEKT